MAQTMTATGVGAGSGMKMTAAEAAVAMLEHKGVKHVWGMPGAAILPVFDAIYRRGNIKSYGIRHEQKAVFAADGWARVTRTPGVCMVTSGPAAAEPMVRGRRTVSNKAMVAGRMNIWRLVMGPFLRVMSLLHGH